MPAAPSSLAVFRPRVYTVTATTAPMSATALGSAQFSGMSVTLIFVPCMQYGVSRAILTDSRRMPRGFAVTHRQWTARIYGERRMNSNARQRQVN
ncbi:hypothetical protein GCM10010214_10640 [Streptomyces abikoensis]|nr:hypothetical protein GCM10010214_10640 [Streptomyces abikoensis]